MFEDILGRLDFKDPGVALGVPESHFSGPIRVSLDQVSTYKIRPLRRRFEIGLITGLTATEIGQTKGFGCSLDLEGTAGLMGDG